METGARTTFWFAVDVAADAPVGPVEVSADVHATVDGADARVSIAVEPLVWTVIRLPTVRDVVPQVTEGCVELSYTLAQASGAAVDVTVERAIGGDEWSRVTMGRGGEGVRAVGTSAAGRAHTFVWNPFADLGVGPSASVMLRVSACVHGVCGEPATATSSVTFAGRPGTFSSARAVGAGAQSRAVALADLDGDARLDLVVANGGTDDVTVRLSTGGGSFGPAASFATGDDPRVLVLADVDRDGRLDAITANRGSGDVSVLRGAGGVFLGAPPLAAGTAPVGLAVADLDGDGDLDIAAVSWGRATSPCSAATARPRSRRPRACPPERPRRRSPPPTSIGTVTPISSSPIRVGARSSCCATPAMRRSRPHPDRRSPSPRSPSRSMCRT